LTDEEVRREYLRTHDPFNRPSLVCLSVLFVGAFFFYAWFDEDSLPRLLFQGLASVLLVSFIVGSFRARRRASMAEAGSLRDLLVKSAQGRMKYADLSRVLVWMLSAVLILWVVNIVQDAILDEPLRYRMSSYTTLPVILLMWIRSILERSEIPRARATLESLGEAPIGA